mgnify:FL=1|tara:strand:+ start:140 stop:898 length:759 start_codon:yes stop_codon:yes gene_type:complete
MKRDDLVQEMLLRENIRKVIKVVKTRNIKKRSKELMAENMLRKAVRSLLVEKAAVPDEIPNRSTGINVLEDLLKKIIPVLEADFKSLTTSEEQRGSFRAHILNGIQNIIAVANTNADAGIMVKEDIDISVEDETDDRFIDIDPEDKKDVDPKDEFSSGLGDSDLDQTGRNVAFNAFKKIEQNILDAYELLSDSEDKKIFYDYLLTNTKLYFDKFEDELSNEVPDITTPEYEEAAGKESAEDAESAELEDTEL